MLKHCRLCGEYALRGGCSVFCYSLKTALGFNIFKLNNFRKTLRLRSLNRKSGSGENLYFCPFHRNRLLKKNRRNDCFRRSVLRKSLFRSAFSAISGPEMGFIVLRNGAYQKPKWAVSQSGFSDV